MARGEAPNSVSREPWWGLNSWAKSAEWQWPMIANAAGCAHETLFVTESIRYISGYLRTNPWYNLMEVLQGRKMQLIRIPLLQTVLELESNFLWIWCPKILWIVWLILTLSVSAETQVPSWCCLRLQHPKGKQTLIFSVCKPNKVLTLLAGGLGRSLGLGAETALARIRLAPAKLQAQSPGKTWQPSTSSISFTTKAIKQPCQTHLHSSIDIPQPQPCLRHDSWSPRSPQCSAPLLPVPHVLRSVAPLSCSSTAPSEPSQVPVFLAYAPDPNLVAAESPRANQHVPLTRHGPLPPAQQCRQIPLPNPEASTSQQCLQGFLRASNGAPVLLRARWSLGHRWRKRRYRSRYNRSCWCRCGYRNGLWVLDHRCGSQPKYEGTIVRVCYFGFRLCWSYWVVRAHGGIHDPLHLKRRFKQWGNTWRWCNRIIFRCMLKVVVAGVGWLAGRKVCRYYGTGRASNHCNSTH